DGSRQRQATAFPPAQGQQSQGHQQEQRAEKALKALAFHRQLPWSAKPSREVVVSEVEAILLLEGYMHVWIREEPVRERGERVATEDLILDHPWQDEKRGHSAYRESRPKPRLAGAPLRPDHKTERIGNADCGSIFR